MAYPYYTTPYANAYPTNYWNPVNPIQIATAGSQQPQYMISVDGENSAKSWQPSVPPQPNTIIPLFDSDGEHVYFKTFDSYGRMNPVRKGRIVFDDEMVSTEPAVDMSSYVTKNDLDKFKEDIMNQLESLRKQNNQNGNTFRGEKR